MNLKLKKFHPNFFNHNAIVHSLAIDDLSVKPQNWPANPIDLERARVELNEACSGLSCLRNVGVIMRCEVVY